MPRKHARDANGKQTIQAAEQAGGDRPGRLVTNQSFAHGLGWRMEARTFK